MYSRVFKQSFVLLCCIPTQAVALYRQLNYLHVSRLLFHFFTFTHTHTHTHTQTDTNHCTYILISTVHPRLHQANLEVMQDSGFSFCSIRWTGGIVFASVASSL